MDPLPLLNKVYSLVAQEESHEGIDVVDDSKVLVNVVESKKPYGKGKGFTPQGGKERRQCSFCGNQVSTSVSTGHQPVEATTLGNAYCSLPLSHCLACVKSNS